jgi:mRNA-degrading endonuclease HigB of HigAB toxin-antitoxin module
MLIFNKLHKYLIEKNTYYKLNTYMIGIYSMNKTHTFVIYNNICVISDIYVDLIDINEYEKKCDFAVYPESDPSPGHVNCSYTNSDIMKKDKTYIELYKCPECKKDTSQQWTKLNISDIVKTRNYRISGINRTYSWHMIVKKHKIHKQMNMNNTYTAKGIYYYDKNWKLMFIEIAKYYDKRMIYVKYGFNKIYIRHMSMKIRNYSVLYELINDKHYVKA